MGRTFEIPNFYRGNLVTKVKQDRMFEDPKRKDLSPTILQFGKLKVLLARHFGFCFGVENAIETAYRILQENPGKRIFLLSEMIHNPQVNSDLNERGIGFLMKTNGTRLVDFNSLTADDIVIIPAFGTTLEILEELKGIGINALQFDATCPFVERVWKKSRELGKSGFSVIIHGKKQHEETKATFSHARMESPSLIVRDLAEAQIICSLMKRIFADDETAIIEFKENFRDSYSANFQPKKDLLKIGVVNQTTMLASETLGIASLFKETMKEIFGESELSTHFAETRDTLCYATNENQSATIKLRDEHSDFALVVGGYNSSNTSHLVELLCEKIPTFYIKEAKSLISKDEIEFFDLDTKEVIKHNSWLDNSAKEVTVAITAGASCPDRVVEDVIERLNFLVNDR